VGLVTGACLSHLGHRVRCVDKDEDCVRVLSSGRIPFYEPGLKDLVSRGVRSGRLSFAGLEGLMELAREGEVIFIAVDTPKGRADLPTSRVWQRSPGA
jgi:UDPglucose 6-dehydrogenase